MNEDMMNMIQKMSEMMGNKEIPDEIKNVLNSMNMNNCNNSENTEENNFENNGDFCRNNNDNNDFMGDFDLNTILKIKQIMDSLKNDKQNDYRTNLLLALKPYVRESRKDKIDTYIKLMKMEKIIDVIKPMGGEN